TFNGLQNAPLPNERILKTPVRLSAHRPTQRLVWLEHAGFAVTLSVLSDTFAAAASVHGLAPLHLPRR
ncbi:hypothetical protein LXE07_21095, partial [Yersinia enterocolitica]|uniref:hypothetical protein n=1 Tax=Yersinia enterocolitica TaxID=630 RepID=UPI001E42F4AF